MKKIKVGLQLFSIRTELEKDFEKTLRKVKEIGYDYVEFAGYYGKTAREIKSLLDDIGLKAVSVHQTHGVFLDGGKEEIEFLKVLKARYVAIPSIPPSDHAGSNTFDRTVKELQYVGKLLKDNGMQLLYHNHDYEFEKVNGEFKLDILFDSVDKELLMTQIDTCWVNYSGVNAAEYINKYSDRSPVIHLKDFVATGSKSGAVYTLIDADGKEIVPSSKSQNSFEFKPLGKGVQNFPEILKAAENSNCEYVIVEQDRFTDIEPLDCITISREYLKKLGY